MQIKPVVNKSDLKAFIELPYSLYRDDPVWVAPLRSDQWNQFDPAHNPTLDHCEISLYLLEDKGKVIGRIAAFIDRLAVDYWKDPVGLFGSYECIDDPQASYMLLDTARQWLLGKNMRCMRGPWSFVSQEWGVVVEGYSPSPVIMAPYNPPYYNDQFRAFGFSKVKDLVCYEMDAAQGYTIPERILTLTDKVQKRYGVRVRALDMNQYEQEIETVLSLSNQALANNWGYAPVTEAEVRAMARDLKPVIHAKGVLFAEDSGGRPVGFAIAIPDVNTLLKGLDGRLFPFGWIKLLAGIPRLKRYRMFALGVIPEYQGKGIDSLIYRALYESLYQPDIYMEINYILEDNGPMNNAVLKLNGKPLRVYRIYQVDI